MGATEHRSIEQLRLEDAAAGLVLSSEAHWNQTEDDWLTFLSRGTVYGIRDSAGVLIATAALLPYAGGNAWISMVLVTSRFRGRGIATKLLDCCLDTAAQQELTTWLDATPAGAAIYGPLGFTPSIQLSRMRFDGTPGSSQGLRLLTVGSLDDLIARDRRAMGFDRSLVLGALASRPESRLAVRNDAICLIRNGLGAHHIGPVFADHSASAAELIESVIRTAPGPFLLDVAGDQHRLVERLTLDGWTIERSFQRMRLGRIRTRGTELPFAGAGPEYG
ncbi:GNAT family N-acetyltransferase [soil metagenome]